MCTAAKTPDCMFVCVSLTYIKFLCTDMVQHDLHVKFMCAIVITQVK